MIWNPFWALKNPLPVIAITVMISSKPFWQDTRNSCTVPQNRGRELPRDTPSHIVLLFTPLEAGRNTNKANEPQSSWLFPETCTHHQIRKRCASAQMEPAIGKKSYSQQFPRTAVESARFIICRSEPAQHKQFKHRLLKIPSPRMGSWSSCNCSAIASVCIIKTSCLCASFHPRNICANTFFTVNVKNNFVAAALTGPSKVVLVF